MDRFLLFLSIAIVACQPQSDSAQQEELPLFEEALPAEVGMIMDSLDLIVSHMQLAIDSQWIAGGVALIARHGKIVYHHAVGFSDQGLTKLLAVDNIFRMASMTKPITSVAVMQLVEQGKISTQDPVAKYIPEFGVSRVIEDFNDEDSTYNLGPANREITIHDLLTHTSGLAYGIFHPIASILYPEHNVVEGWTIEPLLLKDNAVATANYPLMHHPGEKWTYGVSTDVLGRIVEVASGQPLDEYFAQNIFQPLGMADTYFYLPDEKATRLVDVFHTFDYDPEKEPDYYDDDYPIIGAKTYFGGGAGLSSTALDYFIFCDALRSGGTRNGATILQSETVDLMTHNRIDSLWIGKGRKFGYGFATYQREGPWARAVGSYSWGGYFQTTFWIDPSRDIIAVLLTNARHTTHEGDIYTRFEDIVYSAISDEDLLSKTSQEVIP